MTVDKLDDVINEGTGKSETSTSATDKNRFIYVDGNIDEDKAKDVIERLLELQTEDPLVEVTMIINGCGGEIYSMFAITDSMDMIYPPVRTICLGTAQSASAFIFLCGEKGKRFMSPHSGLMLHQVSGGTQGTSSDIDVQVNHMRHLQKQMIGEIANRSSLDEDRVKALIDRDCHIDPERAIEFGMCDGIIERLS